MLIASDDKFRAMAGVWCQFACVLLQAKQRGIRRYGQWIQYPILTRCREASLLDHLILSLITTHILIDRRQEVTPARRVRIDATIADSKQVCPFEGPIFGQSNVGLGMKVLDMARHRIVVSDIDLAERAQATLISNRFKPTRSVSGGAFVHCVVAHGLPRTGRKSIPES